MKKSLFAIALFVCGGIFAQSSILLTNNGTSATLAPNSTIYKATAASDNVKVTLDIKNTSGSTKTYIAKRYDITLNATSNATASAYFCFAGNCYGENILVSPTSITLTAGQSASQVNGSFQMLIADLDEADVVGLSKVKYTFLNEANSADSVQITIQYNGSVPTGINNNSSISPSLELFPNPSRETVSVSVSSLQKQEAQLMIFNSLGAVILEKNISIEEGKNTFNLNLSKQTAGVYFVNIKGESINSTKRLVKD